MGKSATSFVDKHKERLMAKCFEQKESIGFQETFAYVD